MSEIRPQYQLDKKIDWVFFDLDNTLWDFDKNAEKALHELYRKHDLHLHTTYRIEQFVQLYKDVNASYWKRYELGEIDKDKLRTGRFIDTFVAMGIEPALQPANIWNEYLEICPQMTDLMPGAIECLSKLSQVFKIGVLTNGFENTQNVKIEKSGIDKYIQFLQTSESAKLAKPNEEFFQLALSENGVNPTNCVYIGDNLNTDVWGGMNSGIITFHYLYDVNNTLDIAHPLFGGTVTDLVDWACWLIANQAKYESN